jgi:hypothetical protein
MIERGWVRGGEDVETVKGAKTAAESRERAVGGGRGQQMAADGSRRRQMA